MESFLGRATEMAKSKISISDMENESIKWAAVESELSGIFGELLREAGASAQEIKAVKSEVNKYGDKAAQLQSTVFPGGPSLSAGFFTDMTQHATNAEVIVNNVLDKKAGTRDTNEKKFVRGMQDDLDIFANVTARLFMYANGQFSGFAQKSSQELYYVSPRKGPSIDASLKDMWTSTFKAADWTYETFKSAGADIFTDWVRDLANCWGSLLGLSEDPSLAERRYDSNALARHDEVLEEIHTLVSENKSNKSIKIYQWLSMIADKVEENKTVVWDDEQAVAKWARILEMALATAVLCVIGFKYTYGFTSRADNVAKTQDVLDSMNPLFRNQTMTMERIQEINLQIGAAEDAYRARVILSNTDTVAARAKALAIMNAPPTFVDIVKEGFAEIGCPYPPEWNPATPAKEFIETIAQQTIASGLNATDEAVFKMQSNATIAQPAPIECDAKALMTYTSNTRDIILAQALTIINTTKRMELLEDEDREVVLKTMEEGILNLLNATLTFNDTIPPAAMARRLLFAAKHTGVVHTYEMHHLKEAQSNFTKLDLQLQNEIAEMEDAERRASVQLQMIISPLEKEKLQREAELVAISNEMKKKHNTAAEHTGEARQAIDNPIQQFFKDLRRAVGIGSMLATAATFLEHIAGGNYTAMFDTIRTSAKVLGEANGIWSVAFFQNIGTILASLTKIVIMLQLVITVVAVLAPFAQIVVSMCLRAFRALTACMFDNSLAQATDSYMRESRFRLLSSSAHGAYALFRLVIDSASAATNGIFGGFHLIAGFGLRWGPLLLSCISALFNGLCFCVAALSFGSLAFDKSLLVVNTMEAAYIFGTRLDINPGAIFWNVGGWKRGKLCTKVFGKTLTKLYEAQMTHKVLESLAQVGAIGVVFGTIGKIF
jgi:hypothetical protein